MKKIKMFVGVLALLMLALVSSCGSKKTYKVLVPNGTPLLGMSSFIEENSENLEYEVVAGSSALVAGFVNSSYDIIVAPINLGAKMYNQTPNYTLYKSFVWGNFYLASLNEFTDVNALNGKKIVVFGASSSPDVMFKVVKNYLNLNVEIEYVDDVASANAMLVSGKVEYILSAEPSISVLRAKKNIYTLSLQSLWSDATNGKAFPQAGIFIKSGSNTDKEFNKLLNKLTAALDDYKDPKSLAEKAIKVDDSFSKMGVEALTSAIPNCNFNLYDKTTEKEYVKCYLEKLIELGLAPQVGGKMPSDEFYG